MRLAITTKISLNKKRATWYYTAHNAVGGSSSSNHCGTKKVALAAAAVGLLPGESVEVVTNGKFDGRYYKNPDGSLVKL